jgi:hypothetical protein
VVQAETFELAAKVCELADKLGLKNNSYLSATLWCRYKAETCYSFHTGDFADVGYFKNQGEVIISAVEWLNRHDMFVIGSEEPFICSENYKVIMAKLECCLET